ncbi:SDR family NAD(P)-dependent oxidoreductase [Natronosporangium hydrolyticum]|uniref:SDR family NAD(P)-dependent oxidoreductase n=2 Tax=Natronosporangium hydrolyticum TaxID=2811111 RepID=A0A895YJ45_9ACTN|nr:type I polyketide synthase [Natronosporangium hydrolyticum]QSB16015.1 SDR family NAD(P)-dependent oxidoreductase [Natronosporangium hydrolyticum]
MSQPADSAFDHAVDEEPTLLRQRLQPFPAPERLGWLTDLVGTETAAVLNGILPEPVSTVDVDAAFQELGFDSLAAVELQARLANATGMDLPVTLVFDHPTPLAVARFLLAVAFGEEPDIGEEKVGPVPIGTGLDEPIAIVGIGCRFPGGVTSPEELWRLIADDRHVSEPFPEDRGWDLDSLFDSDPGQPGTSYVRAGGFLPDAAEFDAEFFGIGPREAAAMDPQQRLVLETTWEAIERANIDPTSLRGSRTGVFVGAEPQEYGPRLYEAPAGLDGYLLTGNAPSVISGRVAYWFGWEGPTLTVDTACSGSLVALHLACQAIRRGEVPLAIAGGVAVMGGPGTFTAFSRQRGLAPDGRCKPFAAAADGTGFAEGVGIFVLERLSDAHRNGHRVLAVVRGSAINSDGASNGLTAPNGPSQQRVIRQALADAGLTVGEVDVVEAHGTGTRLGDPIEAQALLATYGRRDPQRPPLWLGSVKSNIGHAQAAAGAAGVIKMVLAMRHDALPRTLHVDEPTPHVDWESGAVQLLTEAQPWPGTDRRRRAGVSSFGVSGTNAHVIIEEAPPSTNAAPTPGSPTVAPYLLSARSPQALRAQAAQLAPVLAAEREPGALAWTLAQARAGLPERLAVLAADHAEALRGMRAVADGGSGPELLTATPSGGKLGFLFTGQGAQRPGMGRELYQTYPVYAEALDEVLDHLDIHFEQPVRDVLFAQSGSATAALLDQTQYAQAALFAVGVALYRQFESWGVTPDLLLGHSLGELTAAHVAGVLDLPDAALLVSARGQLMQALPAGGAMVAISAPEDDVRRVLAVTGGAVDIAAVNGPAAVVVSGDSAAVARVTAELEADGRRCLPLRVSHAFHSPLMEPMLEKLRRVASTLTFHEPRLPIVSNVSGERATDGEHSSPDYWVHHVRRAVRFQDGMRALAAAGVTTYLELGPDAVLTTLGRACLAAQGPTTTGDQQETALLTPAVRRGHEEPRQIVEALTLLHLRGRPVAWRRFFPHRDTDFVDLPTYPFQRQRYWLGPGSTASAAGIGQTPVDHPVLASQLELANDGRLVLTGRVSLTGHQWLADHVLAGQPLLPGTLFVELARQAGEPGGTPYLEELTLQTPLAMPAGRAAVLQVVLGAADETGRRAIEIYASASASEPAATWVRHASGVLGGTPSRSEPVTSAWAAEWPPPGAAAIDLADWYPTLARQGYEYGAAFQSLRGAWRRGDELFVDVGLPEAVHDGRSFGVHPVLLDGVLQSTELLTGGDGAPGIQLPFAWQHVQWYSLGVTSVRARVVEAGDGVQLELADINGVPVASVGAFVTRPAAAQPVADSAIDPADGALYQVNWLPVPTDPPSTPVGWAYWEPEAQTKPASTVAVYHCSEPAPGASTADAAEAATTTVLAVLHEWLSRPRTVDAPLVVTTRGAVAAADTDQLTGLAQAGVWGLVRAAQAEHPGAFLLLDLDESAPVPAGDRLGRLLAQAVGAGETEFAYRDNALLTARLGRVAPSADEEPAQRRLPTDWASHGTILITGGTGGLGRAVARHLASEHGAGHLLLVSRRGEAAPDATEFLAELATYGTEVSVAACDLTDPGALAALLSTIPAHRPLNAVIHAAGVLDNALVESLTPEQIRAVHAPKAAAAWHLHQLTADQDLAAFVLFSSSAGLLDGAGQANYAAANTFLDALAGHRRATGRPAHSLAWGLWSDADGMGAELAASDRRRIDRLGLAPLRTRRSLALLDAALAEDSGCYVPVGIDEAALRTRGEKLPGLLRSLVRVSNRARHATTVSVDGEGPTLARSWSNLADAARRRAALTLVLGHTAAVLGHAHPEAVDPDRAFNELGFDSLAAVELRNALSSVLKITLPPTLVFDYPTPNAVAAVVLERVVGAEAPPPSVVVHDRGTDEPIAIVGMGCRLPGGVGSPEDLWDLVWAGVDAVGPFPRDRGWDVEGLFDPDGERAGSSYVVEGGFLYDAAGFDAEFFGISPREALAMDPQQRLLLEVSWEALERAGIDPSGLRGSRTGVYAGVMYHDWASRLGSVPEDIAGYLGNGSLASVVSGRVAYHLGLEGPAVTVDTACSSSLVALHLAVQALRSGECAMALAGGVTVMATPDTFVDFSRQRGLAADGRCKSFSADADGTGWAEGAGVLVLERLSDARAAGRRVLAVVRGSAVNQDGASNGLTAPNGPAQERVIRAALGSAGVGVGDVDVVEGHGTGTSLGDPIEVGALLGTYGRGRGGVGPLWLGSLKSNIGHAQAAAGVAGVIKMVLALRFGWLPRTLHVDVPSGEVDWSSGGVELLREAVEWRSVGGRVRRAGVSSFGISGTNAHVIVEEAPPVEAGVSAGSPVEVSAGEAAAVGGGLPVVLPVSGVGWGGLRGQLGGLVGLVGGGGVGLGDVGWSLGVGRAGLGCRAVVVADGGGVDGGVGGVVGLLSGVAGGGGEVVGVGGSVVLGEVVGGRTVFMFSGQGSQRVGMGRGLYGAFGVFREVFDEVCGVFDGLLGCGLRGVVFEGVGGDVDRTVFAQAGLFAVEVALFRLLESWGVGVDVVVGHSVGEVAAAYVVGVLGLEDACRLVVGGAGVVESGGVGGFGELVGGLGLGGVSGGVVAVSSVLGGVVGGEWSDPGFWVSQVGAGVRFGDVVGCLRGLGVSRFVEVGPGGVWAGVVREGDGGGVAGDGGGLVVGSLWGGVGGLGEVEGLLVGVSRVWVSGGVVDWSRVLVGGRWVDLPTYAFQHKRYWLESLPSGGDVTGAGQQSVGHPLLAAAVPSAVDDGVVLTGRWSLATHPWLADHVVQGRVIVPGTAFVELVLHAGERVGASVVRELALEAPLVLPESGGVAVQVVVGGVDGVGGRSVAVYSCVQDGVVGREWVRHGVGVLGSGGLGGGVGVLGEWPPVGGVRLEVGDAYERLGVRGYGYGPVFRGLRGAWRRGDEVFAEVVLPEGVDGSGFGLHPALFDAAMHADLLGDGPTLMPFVWNDVRLHAEGAQALRVRIRRLRGDELSKIEIFDVAGNPVAAVGSLVSRPVSEGQLSAGPAAGHESLLRIDWQPRPVTRTPLPAGLVTIGAPLFGEYGSHQVADVAELRATLDQGGVAPELALLGLPPADPAGDFDPSIEAAAATAAVMATIQEFLADPRLASCQLIVVTQNGVMLPQDEPGDEEAHQRSLLARAPLWGLVRAAEAENPGRFGLVDVDGVGDVAGVVGGLVGEGEPEVVVRGGGVFVPRLVRVSEVAGSVGSGGSVGGFGGGAVLVTGGTGGLGALVARHLVVGCGVRDVVLVSRRGWGAVGVEGLVGELESVGARVRVFGCDVGDREALVGLLGEVGGGLSGVVHAAGVAGGGTVDVLDADGVGEVFRSKVCGAWYLHELTRDLELSAFVLFSSAGGLVLAAGQGDYAAANVFLDALAVHRRALGLPGQSLAWGMWQENTGLGGELTAGDLRRMARLGMPALTRAEGIELFDLAISSEEPVLVPLRVDPVAIGRRPDAIPAMLRSIAHKPHRRRASRASGSATELGRQLSALADGEIDRTLLQLVRDQVATVLGYEDAQELDTRRAFKELGFDSLAAVELRNALGATTGLSLPATLVFDYPNAQSVAEFLREKLVGERVEAEVVSAVPIASATTDDPVVIVGMSCRYAGGVATPAELWQLLMDEVDAITSFPEDRGWDIAGIYDPEPGKAGKSYTREGGFLHDAAAFDPEFFGIGPREALAMDPQQRLLLEAAWEAFERAGIDPTSMRGSNTGVFAGVMYDDYGPRLKQPPKDVIGYLANGSSGSVVSGRVSYLMGLEGPAMTIDTACSSSLVALHLAAQSVRNGECSMALAGGVTVLSTTDLFVDSSRQGVLSPNGRCKSFASAADGVGWAEGVGLLLVERLSDARRNDHPVLAVVRGSAVNQDGASNGLTAPNGPSQERVIRKALASAGLSTQDVDAVEAHGSGTRLGDPIEAQALLATYGEGRERPLMLGSIKSNIGHAQAAGGVAGVIKMVLALRFGWLPRTLHVDVPSGEVDWSSGGVELLREAVEWRSVGGRVRRAGVSSFGISGTNAHVIVEEAPPVEAGVSAGSPVEVSAGEAAAVGGGLPVVLPVSGVGWGGLRGQLGGLVGLVGGGGVGLGDVGWSLGVGRAGLGCRAVVVADGGGVDGGVGGVVGLLSGVAGGGGEVVGVGGSVVLGEVVGGRTVFMFSGQGSQRVGMGRGLYGAFGVFREVFDEVCGVFDGLLGCGLRGVVFEGVGGDVDRTVFAQAGLFAVEVALFRLLESWGVGVDVVVGHSVGEVAAAYVVGVLGLEDACRLVVGGAGVVESGGVGGFGELVGGLGLGGVSGGVVAVSSVLGGVVGGEWSDPGFWVSQVGAGVRFGDVVGCLRGLGVSRFVEVGPGGVWAGVVREGDGGGVAGDGGGLVVGSLWGGVGGLGEVEGLLVGVSRVWVSGGVVDWSRVLVGGRWVDLPTYAFQRQRYWLMDGATTSGDLAEVGLTGVEHPLLSVAVPSAVDDGVVLTGRWSLATHPWLGDHMVHGTVVVPGSLFVELALTAGERLAAGELRELTQEAPLLLNSAAAVTVQVIVGGKGDDGKRPLTIYSRDETRADDPGAWARHASGLLGSGSGQPELYVGVWPPPGADPLDITSAYQRAAEDGYGYGPLFQGLRVAWRVGDEVYGEVALPDGEITAARSFGLHPALLDSALDAAGFVADESDPSATTLVPFAWQNVVLQSGGAAAVRVRVSRCGDNGAISLRLFDSAGQPVASIGSLSLRPVTAAQLASGGAPPDSLFRIEWQSATLPDGVAVSSAMIGRGGSEESTAGFAKPASLAALRASLDNGQPSPELVAYTIATELIDDTSATLPERLRRVLAEVLELIQEWLSDPRLVESRLVLVAECPEPSPIGVIARAVAGLVRAAESENPGQFAMLHKSPSAALPRRLPADEPELLVTPDGTVTVPRLVPAGASQGGFGGFGGGAVLVTGGTGGLGALVARHLVVGCGVRDVVLVSRRGWGAVGVEGLVGELESVGARVRVFGCDVGDREALVGLLGEVGGGLSGVVHAAGVVDDGVVSGLSVERLGRVLSAKVDGAWGLHELLGEVPLIFFSSASGTVDAAGQGGYAAANAALDGLAEYRRAQGLPTVSLAWGLWQPDEVDDHMPASAMTSQLTEVDLERLRRLGTLPLSSADGLALFDVAIAHGAPVLIPLPVDRDALRLRIGEVPAALRSLAGVDPTAAAALTPASDSAPTELSMAEQLAGLRRDDQIRFTLELVCTHVATVLGIVDPKKIDVDRGFLDLGLDSLSALELRNSLAKVTGLRLPATLIFDYPSPRPLAELIRTELCPEAGQDVEETDEEACRRAIRSIPVSRLQEAGLLESLLALAATEAESGDSAESATGAATTEESAEAIRSMDVDDLVRAAFAQRDNTLPEE